MSDTQGRVASEISTCNEVVITEMLFDNVLTNLEPEVIVALLSSMVGTHLRSPFD